jgi:ribosomal protein S14|tara:strand:+ start:290 stop:613 length:324 start_codon:yes stop_codon:yes gene_type:complete
MGSNPIVSKMSKRKFKTDGINRLQFEKDELKVLALRFFKSNQELPKKNILLSNMLSSKLSKGLYKFRNRCILTSRSRGVFSKLSISRILFRKMFSKGFLPGYRKSSW